MNVSRADQSNGWYGIIADLRSRAAAEGEVVTDIEDIEGESSPTPPMILCPFHAFDFNLGDGHSSTGLRACTYRVEEREDRQLYLEPPGLAGDDFRVLGVREVSEREQFQPA